MAKSAASGPGCYHEDGARESLAQRRLRDRRHSWLRAPSVCAPYSHLIVYTTELMATHLRLAPVRLETSLTGGLV